MKSTNNKFTAFLRRNAFYFVLGLCILAVGLSVTFVVMEQSANNTLNNEKPSIEVPTPELPDDPGIIDPTPETPTEPDTDVGSTKIVFCMPKTLPGMRCFLSCRKLSVKTRLLR